MLVHLRMPPIMQVEIGYVKQCKMISVRMDKEVFRLLVYIILDIGGMTRVIHLIKAILKHRDLLSIPWTILYKILKLHRNVLLLIFPTDMELKILVGMVPQAVNNIFGNLLAMQNYLLIIHWVMEIVLTE